MATYNITKAYPDGVDADFRIDAFDITGLGEVSIDDGIGLIRRGDRLIAGPLLFPADVVIRKHWAYPYREFLTTLPDGDARNNLSTLARQRLGSVAAALAVRR